MATQSVPIGQFRKKHSAEYAALDHLMCKRPDWKLSDVKTVESWVDAKNELGHQYNFAFELNDGRHVIGCIEDRNRCHCGCIRGELFKIVNVKMVAKRPGKGTTK